MSQIVKCDICGGIYNQSHLSSHKRLSHGKHEPQPKTVAPTLEVVLSMYAQLPEESKRKVRERLTAANRAHA